MSPLPCLLLVLASLPQVEAPERPAARRGDHRERPFEHEVADPYRWMESGEEAFHAWVADQDGATRRAFESDPERSALEARLLELSAFVRAGVPVTAGGRTLRSVGSPGRFVRPLFVDGDAGEQPRLLVPTDDHPLDPAGSLGLSEPLPSPDGRYLLYGAGSSRVSSVLRIVDVASGVDADVDQLPVRYQPWRVAWLPGADALLYVQGPSVRLHRVGAPVDQDALLFRSDEQPPPELEVDTSADGRCLYVTVHHVARSTTSVLVHRRDRTSDQPWQDLTAGREGTTRFVGQVADTAYLTSTHEAPNLRVVAVDLDAPDEWRSIVPEADEPLWDNDHPIRPATALLDDRLVLLYGRQGQSFVRLFDLDGQLLHEIHPPSPGFNESGLVPSAELGVVRYDVQSMVDPGTVWELDVSSGEARPVARSQVPFDPADYVTTALSCPGEGGVELPLVVTRRRDVPLDGGAPVLLHASGVFGVVARPVYLPFTHAWLERGGVFVQTGVRGGGERGATWHDAGRGPRKGQAARDLIACARWIADQGWAPAQRIGVLATSASGPAGCSAVLQAPEAFGAALIRIAQLDMLRHRASTEEFGDPADPTDLAALLGWSPYQLVERNGADGGAVPFLVQVGEGDTLAPSWHGAKLVAALQHARGGPGDVALQWVAGAGHSQGVGIEQQADTHALQLAWLFRALSGGGDG